MNRAVKCLAAFALTVVLTLACPSCAWRRGRAFQVLPRSPAYLLRSPDSRETPFPEVLREYNDFEPGKSWMDLRPLMDVRIENAYYEKGSSRRGLQGYLGTEVARYQVRPEGLQLASVQHMPNRPAADPPVQQLISASVRRAPYHRLYFEIVFNAISHTHGSVLLAGASKEEVERLASQLTDPENLCRSGSSHCTAFPEACSVSVEIEIVVNGKSDAVIWGSLLTSVTGEHPQHVEVQRLYAGRPAPIKINFGDAAALRLPLLPGDRVTWN